MPSNCPTPSNAIVRDLVVAHRVDGGGRLARACDLAVDDHLLDAAGAREGEQREGQTVSEGGSEGAHAGMVNTPGPRVAGKNRSAFTGETRPRCRRRP